MVNDEWGMRIADCGMLKGEREKMNTRTAAKEWRG